MEISNSLRDGMSGFLMALEAQKSATETLIKPVEQEAHKQLVAPAARDDDDNRALAQAVTGMESTINLTV